MFGHLWLLTMPATCSHVFPVNLDVHKAIRVCNASVLLTAVLTDLLCALQIATVDKYQGQQNDYILLSLVRTRAVGHIRDVRRLVVAMSRARLGLYIFGRAELFANCYELRPAMKQLLDRPQQLHLHLSERLSVNCQDFDPCRGCGVCYKL